ncbi:hypothetical protein QCA50_004511 [Cerrena zonata]|uniref:Yeast cell wall synthesis Kre9/Knh1-like N-terminal domain-containing protein n=1 Tax=Cerrena zonata TaxID=2478898 RepID=A0AAW0GJN6_9APHY
MQKSRSLTRLLAYGLLGLQITRTSATYTPTSSDDTQLEKKDNLLSSLVDPSLLASFFGGPADVSEKLEMVENMLNEAGLSDILNKTAVYDVLSTGSELSKAVLNETAILNPLLDGTGLTPELDGILQSRDVYSPKIIQPNGRTVWIAGTTVTVKWDTSNAPKKITNKEGMIVLGYIDDGTSEHLDYKHPLADKFDIMQGSMDVQVPDVEPRDDYIIVLFGDSGNKSPQFTIN